MIAEMPCMPSDPRKDQPARASDTPAPREATTPASAPGVLTTLICEQCGNVNLIRVKGCWYCEKCHYKFDCYGW